MNTILLLAIASLLVGILVGTAGSLLASSIPRLRVFDPGSRIRAILFVLGCPAGLAMLTFLSGLAYAVAVLVGWLPDHCLEHPGHLHLCFLHAPDLSVWLVGLTAAAILTWAAHAVWRPRRYWRVYRMLKDLGSMAIDRGRYLELPHDAAMAVAIGVLHPRVLVTSALMKGLDHRGRDVVLAHEECHARHRDLLVTMCAVITAGFWPASARKALLAELRLAQEQRCDAEAARRSGSVVVAQTILAIARHSTLHPLVPAMNGADLELRILAVLGETQPRIAGTAVAILAVVAAGCAGLAVRYWHHTAETLFGFIL